MTNSISIWTKYAVIAALVKKRESHDNVGRTALQKLVYLLQTLYNVDCGYDFHFYTYGPFSSEILSDLEEMETYNALKIHRVIYQNGYSGYEIVAADECDKILEQAHDFMDENQEKIDFLDNLFGNASAESLELYATIVWVDRDLASKSGHSIKEIESIVRELKPKFSRDVVFKGIEYIKNNNFLLTQP